MSDLLTAVRRHLRIWMRAKPGADLPQRAGSSHTRSVSRDKRRLKLTALGLILLGLWGMLALLLGASVGMESNRRRTQHPDLERGFGETHATRHKRVSASVHEDLPPLCLGQDCPGIEQAADTAYLRPPGHDVPGDEVDDSTSAIGRPRGPETPSPPFTPGGASDPVPNGFFFPLGPPGGNPGGPDSGNPVPGGPNAGNPPSPGDTPPPDFTQPPFSNPPGPDGPGPGGPDSGPGPNRPGPDGPQDGGQEPDPPQQLPEPLTLSLFAGGLAGSFWLRRRRPSQ